MTSILDGTLYVEMGSKILNVRQTKVKHKGRETQQYSVTLRDINMLL